MTDLLPSTLATLNTVGLTSRRVAELEGCGIREAARRLREAGAVGGSRGVWRTAQTKRRDYGQRVLERKS